MGDIGDYIGEYNCPNTWIILIMWLYIALNMTPNIRLLQAGAVPKIWLSSFGRNHFLELCVLVLHTSHRDSLHLGLFQGFLKGSIVNAHADKKRQKPSEVNFEEVIPHRYRGLGMPTLLESWSYLLGDVAVLAELPPQSSDIVLASTALRWGSKSMNVTYCGPKSLQTGFRVKP